MAMSKKLVSLLVLTFIAVMVNANEDCFDKLQRCSGDAIISMLNGTTTVPTGKTRGSDASPYILAMERFCSKRRVTDDCIESSKDVCSASFIRQMRTALQTLGKNCEYLPCAKKVQACAVNIPGMLIKRFSEADLTHLVFGNGTIGEVFCSNKDDFATCLGNSAPECPVDMINSWRYKLDLFNASCEMLPCTLQLNDCYENFTDILMKPKFDDITTLDKVCTELGDVRTCVQLATKCPSNFIRVYREGIDKYRIKCTQIAKCGQSLIDCAGESVKTVKRVFNRDIYDVTTMENLCAEKDKIAACVAKSAPECPADYLTNPLRFQLPKMNASCQLLPCAKKIQACGSTISDMLIDRYWSNRKHMLLGQDINEILCSEKDNFTACLNESAPECPAFVVDAWRQQLPQIDASCKMLPCTEQLNDCYGNLTNTLMKPKFDNTTLDKVCNELGYIRTCIGRASKCPPEMTDVLAKQYNLYEQTCECVEQLNKCNANLNGILMTPKFDVATLHKVCNEFGAIETCVPRANKCPRTYIRSLQTSMNIYKTECTRIARCGQSLQDCAGDSAKTFASVISSFAFDGTSVKKLCAEENKLSSCLMNSESCPPVYVREYQTFMARVRQQCTRTACAMKVQQCGIYIFDGMDIMTLNKVSLLRICNNLLHVHKCLSTLDQRCHAWKKPITYWTDRCKTFVKKNLCAKLICKNGGTCALHLNKAKCVCVKGFLGDHCETPVATTTTVVTPSGQGSVGYATLAIVASLTASLFVLAGYA